MTNSVKDELSEETLTGDCVVREKVVHKIGQVPNEIVEISIDNGLTKGVEQIVVAEVEID